MISRLLGRLRKPPNASRVSKHRMARFILNAEIHEPHDEFRKPWTNTSGFGSARWIRSASQARSTIATKNGLATLGLPVSPTSFHTNTVEGFYSIFKRGMKGVYQHCKEKHLHRYLAEFDFRYSQRVRLGVDDVERTRRALKGIVGKRLTYRTPGNREAVWQEPA